MRISLIRECDRTKGEGIHGAGRQTHPGYRHVSAE
jgi:hypothetical protein